MLKYLINRINWGGQPKETLSAVHDDDLVGLLRSLGVLHSVETGRARCKFCRDQINLSNLQALIPDSGSVSFACNKPGCIRLFINYMEEKKWMTKIL